MARTYIDGLMDEAEYYRQKRLLELESLVIPEVQAAEEAGKLLLDMPRLWALANETERRQLLIGMLDAVYLDTRHNQVVMTLPR